MLSHRITSYNVCYTKLLRLLDYVQPDAVHVLVNGRIEKSGGKELALELEKKGYSWLEKTPAAAAGAGR